MKMNEELMRGDYRALFLGWLAEFHEEWREPGDIRQRCQRQLN